MKISKEDPLHEQLARHQKNTSGCAHDMKKWKFVVQNTSGCY